MRETYALSARHKYCEIHTVTPTHTLRDIDIQRERLIHTEIQTHLETHTNTRNRHTTLRQTHSEPDTHTLRDIMGDTGTETLWESHRDTHPERHTHTLKVIHAH